MTIDNGDNVRLAVDLLGVACMRCFGHTVQTGCTLLDTITAVKDLRTASQKLLTFMSQTRNWNKYVEYMAKHHSSVEPRKLPHPVTTRWWSYLPLYRMLLDDAQYHRGFLAVYNNGKNIDLLINGDMLTTLQVFKATLSPLEELCTLLSGDKYVTASAVLPVTYLLEKLMLSAREISDKQSDPQTWGENEDEQDAEVSVDPAMLKVVLNRLYKRYSPSGWSQATDEGVDVNVAQEIGDRLVKEKIRQCDTEGRKVSYDLLVKCSYLDNRYRADLKEDDVLLAKQQLLNEISDHVHSAEASAGDAPPPAKKKKGMGALFAKLSSYSGLGPSSSRAGIGGGEAEAGTETPPERLKREMLQYEQLSIEKDAEVLVWWKVHEPNFPLLSKLAKKYLAVPATSTESERLFSYAGLVINYLRTCLTGEHAEWLIFLGMNKDFVTKP